jgi:TPR repeat protein
MPHSCRSPIAAVCLSLAGALAWAGDPPELKADKQACEAGQMDACHRLGTLYYQGKTVGMDLKKAAGLFKKACDAGLAAACRDLAQMYEEGDGVEQNDAKALALREKLCAGGDGELCFKLAEDNPDRAAALYGRACDAGFHKGCYDAGLAASRGSGGAKDMARAVELYQKGCDAGSLPACYNGGVALMKGEGVAKDGARAAALFAKACEGKPGEKPERGFEDLQPTACYNLGILNQRGEGVKHNMTRARELFEVACKGNVREGCDAAESARTLERHPEEAASGARGGIAVHMMKSCDDGSAIACRQIADMLLTGTDFLPKNPARAPEYYKRANALNTALCDKGGKGAPMACMELSRAYDAGQGVAKDAARAAALVKKANGHSQAACEKGALDECVTLGLAYQWGIGLPKDDKRAAALYKKACDGGEASGCTQQQALGAQP